MKVQAFWGILYHDMPKLLGRRIRLEGRAREIRKTEDGWIGGSDAHSLSSSSSALLREGKEEI